MANVILKLCYQRQDAQLLELANSVHSLLVIVSRRVESLYDLFAVAVTDRVPEFGEGLAVVHGERRLLWQEIGADFDIDLGLVLPNALDCVDALLVEVSLQGFEEGCTETVARTFGPPPRIAALPWLEAKGL
jgi:hypothetical protein